jgi:hypothetical protein
MAQPARYRIHPAIGIARVGDGPADDYFIGPEQPGLRTRSLGVPRYKSTGRVRRQAARFRIFEYTESGGVWTVSREVTADAPDVVELTWTVHLANRKASFFTFDGLAGSPLLPARPARELRNKGVIDRRKLEIDPLPRSIKGPGGGPVEFSKGTSNNPWKELWPVPVPSPDLTSLGELRTDDKGRLIVIGGGGVITSQGTDTRLEHPFNNDGWFDDVSDGPISAVLRLKVGGGTVTVPVRGAWVLVGPPDFAPDIPPTVTLWDVLLDLVVREFAIPRDEAVFRPGGALARLRAMAKDLSGGRQVLTTYKPSFDEDVAPILRQAILPAWVFKPLQGWHTRLGAPNPSVTVWRELSDPRQPNARREKILRRMRKPGPHDLGGTDNMPHLLGDDYRNKWGTKRWRLSLTVTQYAILAAWARGAFIGSAGPPETLLAPPVEAAITPHGLDRAALESCSGGGFCPGLEVGWQIREPALFAEPFRLRHGARSAYIGDPNGQLIGAGYFSRQMALPWLTDFMSCTSNRIAGIDWGWWPSQRPDWVFTAEHEEKRKRDKKERKPEDMELWHRGWPGGSAAWGSPSYAQALEHWSKFGFVIEGEDGVFFESEERPKTVP